MGRHVASDGEEGPDHNAGRTGGRGDGLVIDEKNGIHQSNSALEDDGKVPEGSDSDRGGSRAGGPRSSTATAS